ncbi:retinol-binding protein pinta-like isoform X1 [Eriocheir sinensis]|uniref:retinol-binding protein pinta-like isoform X1 n=1 Tax=Eriocheir sinensis TaxID=95602 RepID=UPI0021C9D043|nr:retinol-binding protein pinta-like isoform X1 [Eriocheir sinensis]XP_050697158.1 retinol-binding protein pinta-like isoform X1 [Eriocheir sinensis]XP_050697178.1 retinol-binding protein pinta-like isoform X1 [Eriocheir sinensis]XP_050697188.1 retinol-binding protein pinta-like isoform X1 [Eriocheir sinensis]
MGGDKYVCTLSPELLQRAKDEINEDPDRREADIEHIRDWLRHQPHINARMDDWTILRFLRGCKFSLERTKEKLDMFYTCKSLCPEWYKNRDPQDKKLRSILELGTFLPLPGYDHDGRRVVIILAGGHDPKLHSMDEVFKATHLISDIMIDEDEQLSITGVVQILDLKGVTAAHALQMSPPLVKKAMTIWQDGYPMRPKGLNYINTPEAFNTVFNIFKSFMKEKMKRRVHIHGSDMESLYKEVPRDILPVEYGGTNGTVEEIKNYWLQRLDARRDWLLEDEKFCVDESKRPGKAKTSADLFGIEGSFRKLNVD